MDKNSQVSNNRSEKSFTNQVSNKFIVCLTLFIRPQLNEARHMLYKGMKLSAVHLTLICVSRTFPAASIL